MELKKGDLMPTDSEFKILEHFVKVIKPFVKITEALGAEKLVTISSLTPQLYKIHLIVTTDDDRVVVSMKEAMYHDLDGAFNVWYEIKLLFWMLDSSFCLF